MSDTILEKLVASLELRTDNFEKSLAKIRAQSSKHTAEMAGDFHKLTEAVIETGKRVGETFGLTLGAAALYEAPKQIMEIVKSVGELKTAAEKAGVSIEELQKLNFAAIGTGLGQDQLVEMMGQFNKRIGEAATKGGDLKKLLDANGVALRNSNGEIRSASDLLGDVADLVKNTRSDQEATVIATMAFGKAGADVLSFLRQGKDEINAQKQAAQELGAVIGADIVNKADEFDKRWSQSWATWKAEGKAAISELALGYLDWADKQMQPSAGFTPGRTVNGKFVPADQTGLIHAEDPGRVDLPGGLGPRTIVQGPMFGPNLPPANWKSAYDQQVEGLLKHIAAIQAETAAYGQSAGAIARAKAEADALAAIKAKDGVVTDAEVEGLKKYLDQLQKVTDAQEEAAKRQKAMADASQELTSSAQDFVHTLIEGGDALKSLQQTLLKILESIIDANLFGSGPFAGLFGTQGQNGMPGGVLGNLISGLFRPGAAAPASAAPSAATALAPLAARAGGQVFGPFLPQGGIETGPLSNVRIGGSRSWRNNNPGNIEYGPFAMAHGATGSDGRFAIFPDYASGRAAQSSLLFDSPAYRNLTLGQAISKWAPGTENNVPAYIRAMGADPSMRMSQFTVAQRGMLLDNMQAHEGWTVGQYSAQLSTSLQKIPAVTSAAAGQYGSSLGTALASLIQSLFNGIGGGGGAGGLFTAVGGIFTGGAGGSGGGSGLAPMAPTIRAPSMNFPAARAANSNRPMAMSVVVNNHHAGADISQRVTAGPDGAPQLELAVREIDRRMATKYGLTPQVRRRG